MYNVRVRNSVSFAGLLRGRALIAFLCCLALGLYTEKEAGANGRFPKAQSILIPPGGDGSTLYLRTTFGLLVSRDGGKKFRWICEQALGFTSQWDPPIALTKDGRLFIGREDGVLSTKDGCTFERDHAMDGYTVKDFTVDPTGTVVFAITSGLAKTAYVWRRPPGGSWKRLGQGFPEMNLMTIDVAPSNAKRIYMTGQPNTSVRGGIFRSDDGGETFTEYTNDLPANGPFFLSYVDPLESEPHHRAPPPHAGQRRARLEGRRQDVPRAWCTGRRRCSASRRARTARRCGSAPAIRSDGIWRSTDRGEHYERMAQEGIFCLYQANGSSTRARTRTRSAATRSACRKTRARRSRRSPASTT